MIQKTPGGPLATPLISQNNSDSVTTIVPNLTPQNEANREVISKLLSEPAGTTIGNQVYPNVSGPQLPGNVFNNAPVQPNPVPTTSPIGPYAPYQGTVEQNMRLAEALGYNPNESIVDQLKAEGSRSSFDFRNRLFTDYFGGYK